MMAIVFHSTGAQNRPREEWTDEVTAILHVQDYRSSEENKSISDALWIICYHLGQNFTTTLQHSGQKQTSRLASVHQAVNPSL